MLLEQGPDFQPLTTLDMVNVVIVLIQAASLKSSSVPNEDQMSEDFLQFLTNLVKIFPSLSSRPLYLTGESYAGVYIVIFFISLYGLETKDHFSLI